MQRGTPWILNPQGAAFIQPLANKELLWAQYGQCYNRLPRRYNTTELETKDSWVAKGQVSGTLNFSKTGAIAKQACHSKWGTYKIVYQYAIEIWFSDPHPSNSHFFRLHCNTALYNSNHKSVNRWMGAKVPLVWLKLRNAHMAGPTPRILMW